MIKLIGSLIGLFKHINTCQVHSNVMQLLCDVIKISREQILSLRESSSYEYQQQPNDVPKSYEINDLYKASLLEDIERPQHEKRA